MAKSKKRKLDSGDSQKQVKVDMQYFDSSVITTDNDDSNALIVGPKKKKKDKNDEKQDVKKKLSKKERKHLMNVLKRRSDKDRRAELFDTLSKHQATDEMMNQFSSITEVYTQNFKSDPSANNTFEMKANSIKGFTKKQKRLAAADKLKKEEEEEEMEEEGESTDTDDVSTDEEVEKNMEALNQTESDKGTEETKTEEMETEHSTDHDKAKDVTQPENQSRPDDKMETVTARTEAEKAPKVTPVERKPATHIPVNRKPELQEARLKLPILAEEQGVMETINENPVVIICGETGSGKTTQVPQFLYEAGYAHGPGIIAITEPRRVAAISMSKRVGHEMNLSSHEVSYQIRYEGNVTPNTKIKFLTDGVLLKEAQKDPLLTKYSVIIIDEAHERSVYTDILVGLLSIVVRQRDKRGRPLKLIIMSATLRVEDFMGPKLFRYSTPPPVIKVDARQYPVTVHFNKTTHDNYMNEAYRKVCKIHRTLPEGGILVFVTGQQEIHSLIRKLRRMFPYMKGDESTQPVKKESKKEHRKKLKEKATQIQAAPQISLDNYSVVPEDEEAENYGALGLDDLNGDDEDFEEEDNDDEEEEMRARLQEDKPDSTNPLYVLPLFSLLASDKQARVFEAPPEGCRLCVVATNVAETSLTIPNIRYVVDSGKTKTKFFDKVTGVSTFKVTWVSQASADQRAGRAGRLGPGHCYRLYSSAVFEDFSKFAPPEISRRPVEDLVLQMKSMRIDKVANFPFPTQPDAEQIRAAEQLLIHLGALKDLTAGKRMNDLKTAPSPIITALGVTMSAFPVSPRYAKMLVLAREYNVLPYVVALVSALSVDEVFENSIQPADFEGEDKEVLKTKLAKREIFKSRLLGPSVLLGDMMVLLSVVGACEAEGCTALFCHQLGVRTKAVAEIRKLRMQLTNAGNAAFGGEDGSIDLVVDPNLPPPDNDQILAIRKVVLGGLADHVCRRNPPPPSTTEKAEAKKWKGSFQSGLMEDLVYIHPESVLFKNYLDKPEFVVYQDMVETSRLYMRGLCCVESHWFPTLAPSYCVLSKPLEDPLPRFDQEKGIVMCHRSGTFGRCNWEFTAVELPYPDCVDCYRWFAFFLMEGEIIDAFKTYKSLLVLSPSTMVKSWAKLQPKTDSMLNALMARGVNSRQKLLDEWKKNPQYLRSQYLEWLKDSEHADIITRWPLTS